VEASHSPSGESRIDIRKNVESAVGYAERQPMPGGFDS
jgi:hypothetical protein